MKPTHKGWVLSMAAVLLAVAMAWTTVGSAQGQAQAPPPQRILVQVTQVKPDMLGAYEDLIKNDANPALKKAGVPWRWTWANAVTGQGFIRVSVQPVTNFAQFDQPGALQRALGADGVANYNAKLRTMIVGNRTTIETLQPNMSIQGNSGTPPAFAQVTTIQVVSGKAPDFTNIMTADYIPNFKKMGMKDYWVYAVTFGAPQQQFTLVRPMTKYAELDQGPPLTQAVGADAAAQINARRAALIVSSEINYYRYVPDLSFGMPATIVP